MLSDEVVIRETRSWVERVIVGFNFCPFAAAEVERDTLHYRVIGHLETAASLEALIDEALFLDSHPEVETALLIYPAGLDDFGDYLDYFELAEQLMADQGYEGVYQVASFHPDYCFDDCDVDDPANYTNRSPYPMLHLIREATIERLLQHYPDPEQIPVRNIALAREKGLDVMKTLLRECYQK